MDWSDDFIMNISEADVELGHKYCESACRKDMFDMIRDFILNEL